MTRRNAALLLGTIFCVTLMATTVSAGPAVVGSYVVNSTADTNAGTCDGVSGNICTLRDAVAAANANNTGGNISFAPTLAGQTITLTQVGDGTFGPSALWVTGTVSIDGGAAGITITQAKVAPTDNAVAGMRLFYVATNANLTLQRLTLSGGRANGGNGGGNTQGGGAAGLGGAIVNAGTLTITQSTLTNHQAQGGGNTSSGGGGGGGLGFNSPAASVVGGGPNGGTNSVQVAGFGGGGAYDQGFGGYVGGFGGGAGGGNANNGGPGGFGGGGGGSGSTIFGPINDGGFGGGKGDANGGSDGGGGGAGLGGAIFNYGGTITLQNSTLTANSAKGGAGANNGKGLGGAIFNLNGTVNVTYATLVTNVAPDGGGAIYSLGDNGVSTQAGPVLPSATATVAVNNSILFGSTNTSFAPVSDYVQNTNNSGKAGGAVGAASSSGNNNLILSNVGFAGAAAQTDPKLAALANNGGPTQTMLLSANSPAIDAGVCDNQLLTDQRGVMRPQGATQLCDIGAVEVAMPKTFSDINGNTVTIATSTGGIGNVGVLKANPAAAPSGYTYPSGFFSFTVTGLTPGATATVTLTLPAGSNPNRYIKCDNAGATCAPFAGATINGNVVTLTLTDGGAGDSDGKADGVITDPSAPAVSGSGGSGFFGVGAFGASTLLVLLLPALWRRRKLR